MAEILSDNNALSTLQAELRVEMNNLTDNVATGSCKNFPEYTHTVGVIKGLAISEGMLLDLAKRIEEA